MEGGSKTEGEKKRRSKTGAEYLALCADILSKSAYKMCRELWKGKTEKIDPKELKEACAAVKEAAAVINAAEKNEAPEATAVRVIFEEAEYAE